MKLFYTLFLFFTTFFVNSTYAQTTNSSSDNTPEFCKVLLDENQQVLIPQKGLVLIYFFDPRNQNSVVMQKVVNQLKLKETNLVCFKVDASLSQGLKKTYQILNLPSLVILQDKRVIYGLNGFTDDREALTATLNTGIENHLLISPTK